MTLKNKRNKKILKRSINYKKILTTKPTGLFEKFTFLVFLTMGFAIYFGPFLFSDVSPVNAILAASIPSLTTSWILFTLLRLVRYKDIYTIDK